MSIHDFDLIRWLTGYEPKKLWAIGGCYEFKQYKDWDDGDNVSGLMQMENDAMAFFFAGRAAAHGSHVETEIVGTRGTLRIASVPTDSLVEVMSAYGVCRECHQDFITRWHDAYITEIEEFCDCVAPMAARLPRASSTAPSPPRSRSAARNLSSKTNCCHWNNPSYSFPNHLYPLMIL